MDAKQIRAHIRTLDAQISERLLKARRLQEEAWELCAERRVWEAVQESHVEGWRKAAQAYEAMQRIT